MLRCGPGTSTWPGSSAPGGWRWPCRRTPRAPARARRLGCSRGPRCSSGHSCGDVRVRGQRGELVEYGGRRVLAGTDGAVHVAVPDQRGLGAGPVDRSDGFAQCVSEGGPGARREHADVTAAGPLLVDPGALVVGDRVSCLLAEDGDQVIDDHSLPLLR